MRTILAVLPATHDHRRWSKLAVAMLLLAPALAGCIGGLDVQQADIPNALKDTPLVVPTTDFYDVGGEPTSTKFVGFHPDPEPFHTLEEITARIQWWNETYPGLVEVDVIGETWEGNPLWRIVVTDESVAGPKPALLIDGGHHANEMAGVEMSLYLVDLLVENYATNATVRAWLAGMELHTVPLVNPDGWTPQTRGNHLGVNLNRNYDVDWGNQLGASNPVMGTLAHETGQAMPSVAVVAENCGPGPFSEPETQAMRDVMAGLDDRLVAYLSYHTPTNALISPWAAYDAPFDIPADHDAVHEAVLQWTRDNTEYEAGKAEWANFSAGLPYSASGSSMDWAYATHQMPSFTLEIEIWYTSVVSDDYADRVYLTPYPGLRYWLDASLPIPLFLLANWQNLDAWEVPDIEPPLPEGVPPKPVDTTGLVQPLGGGG